MQNVEASKGRIWETASEDKRGKPWAGLDEYVDAYLVCGEERAVLIDSLMGEGNLYSIIRKLPSYLWT